MLSSCRSLDIAKGRVNRLKLTNVRFISDNIQNFNERFDIGISLHACGVATDIAIKKSVLSRAVYISIPCCVGKIAHHDSDLSERSCGDMDICFPRSKEYAEAGCSLAKYLVLAKAADFGHHGFDDVAARSCTSDCDCDCDNQDDEEGSAQARPVGTPPHDGEERSGGGRRDALADARRLSKRLIEQDRNFYARGHRYTTFMTLCFPTSCTPKNDILIGIPDEMQPAVAVFGRWTQVS